MKIVQKFKTLQRILISPIWKLIFSAFGNRSYIDRPLKLQGTKNISIGDNVQIQYKSWLAAVPVHQADKSCLVLKDGAVIGNFNHIYATKSIVIEEDVLLADKVYISDNIHEYYNTQVPIRFQGIVQKNDIVIGKGSWVGENACVIGASIGRNCVVGANAVVTKSIPDYCIAIGVPAVIIKRFNFNSGKWERTSADGAFK